ncbi:polysaccharide biosynthesis C-terminal domain-containing protein [Natrinema zhouii]|uniref:Polysaccharide biosynthesis C-terminal domain-containing protein n=1 Tax=Natrinema zhouii TaxID=1710539 RepID=A0A7D6CPH5_9EURY|nr:polysaccharide biosynthesis C-terminal domain-containing protein [Natrinema zhouii]QLK26777.1 polysaccharide biosynthesis C-terminal domain-containing protein [Natrinema zhouii]
MKIGQTSLVYYGTTVAATVIGFLSTVYFARVLGAERYGVYTLAIAVVLWLKIGGQFGITTAVTKRLSEGDERGAFVVAGAVMLAVPIAALSAAILLFREQLNAYVGVQAASLIVLLFFASLFFEFAIAVLNGYRLVHVSGFVSLGRKLGQALLQVGLVAVGYGLIGMFVGYAVAGLCAGAITFVLFSVNYGIPRRRHFVSVFDFAKFSWLGSLRARSFSNADILVLGAFVPSGLIGIYSVAWSIAKLLDIFGSSIKATLFPEMSKLSAEDETGTIADLVNVSIAYTGLFLIPGLCGSVLLGDRILGIYGDEFAAGATVMWILVAAVLIYSYQRQLVNALNAIDRPDLSFRTNIAFVASNIVLNVVLISLYGWTGAAVATALSAVIGFALAAHYLNAELPLTIPGREIAYQWLSAGVMSAVVYAGTRLETSRGPLLNEYVSLAVLVAVGAGVYFLCLFVQSSRFRSTVRRNVPLDTSGIPL